MFVQSGRNLPDLLSKVIMISFLSSVVNISSVQCAESLTVHLTAAFFLTKTSLNPGIPHRVVILGCLKTGWKVKGNEKSDLRKRRTEGREKKSNNHVFPGIQRWPGYQQQQQKQFSLVPFQRSENETRAATLRRTHSWRSFYYSLGPVIERNKGI
ncbi:hypothetical protein CDAR_230271 [Caerostris darwini]|uniref:Secreted protein n=1 Tax=Caerostris darwini TaxID=1538125 RepID=A0AAV4MKW0_9ARAC|nr:hypothetical protein CDAR_230271 [Caerostris darwini]